MNATERDAAQHSRQLADEGLCDRMVDADDPGHVWPTDDLSWIIPSRPLGG